MPVHRFSFFAFMLLGLSATSMLAQSVRINERPQGLVSGTLIVPVEATAPVMRLELFVNGVPYAQAGGTKTAFQVNVGFFVRRLRIRVAGYDAAGTLVADDEVVVNDPRPPFRVRLRGPAALPETGPVTLTATVIAPEAQPVRSVEFFVGEEKVAMVAAPPYVANIDVTGKTSVYARVVARNAGGEEVNDVLFFGDQARDRIDVTLQHLPFSVASGNAPLRAEDLVLIDDGREKKIETILSADEEPLHVILLIDYSESMLKELPVVKAAAKQFARAVLTPRDRIAVVGFNQKTFWLTGYTNHFEAAAQAVDRVQPIGETHLYDSVIEILYELQKTPGRHALVVLTDGVDQGSRFKLDHLAHYARYAGVPIYPVVKNSLLSRLMRFGVGHLQARRLTEIAKDTGATYFIIRNESELAGVYARIAAELRQQHQAVFYSEAGVQDHWHPVRLESRRGHRLRVPRGYFPD